MLTNTTSYSKQRTGHAKGNLYAIVMHVNECSVQRKIAYAFIKTSKDFIN